MRPILFILAMQFTFQAVAQESSAPIYVEVTGQSLEGQSQTTTIKSFNETEIKNSSSSDLGDFLRKKGLSLKRQGGEGQTSALYLRGADADQVLVIIDGVPVNDVSNPDRRFDFSKVPLSEIRRIEILKGSQSVRYGSQALGGVIRIWTQSSQEKSAYSISAKTGSFRSSELSGSVLHPLGQGFHAGLSGQHFENEGYSAASGGQENDSHRAQSGAASLSYSNELLKSQYSFRAVNQLTDIDRGGGAVNDDPNYLTRFRQDTHSLTTNIYPTELINFEFIAAVSEVERHADNLPDAQSTETSFGDYRGEQQRFQFTQEINLSTTDLNLGYEHTNEKARGESFFSSFPNSTAQKNDFFGSIDQRFRKWTFNLGLRAEEHSEFGSKTSPEIGAGYSVSNNQQLKVRWSKATKWPSLFELYDPAFGNPELKPEESTSLELSWEGNFNALSTNITLFENQFDNLITSDATTFRSINQGKARTRGVELEGEYVLGLSTTELRYQYIEPRQLDPDIELVRRARHELYLAETLKFGNFEIGPWVKYNSRREDFDAVSFERIYLREFWVWGADASYKWQEYRLWASAENLSELSYEEVAGYRAPPRNFWIGLSAEF